MPVVNGGGSPTPTPTPPPPPLTGTGGVFPRMKALGVLLNDINTSRGTTVPTDVAAIQAQYQTTNQDVISNLYNNLSSYQTSAGNFGPNIRTMATNTLTEMFSPIDGQLATALNLLIAQMVSGSQTVQKDTVGGVITYGGANTGNPSFVVSLRDVNYLNTELVFAENITATCTNSSQFTPGIAGTEPFLFQSPPLVTDSLSWLWPTSSGSGLNLTVNACNSLTQSGQSGAANWTVGGSFETWSATANIPTSWVIDTGTPGTTIFQATASGTYYDGASSLSMLGNGSEQTAIKESFSLVGSTGTMRATLLPNVQLGVNVFLKVSSVPAAGMLRIALVDGSGTVVNDNLGNANQLVVNLTTIGSNWYAAGWAFRTPAILPSAVFLQLKLTTALSNGVSLYIDRVSLNQMTRLYAGGPYVSIFSGNINMAKGDVMISAINNDFAGNYQVLFDRLFSMKQKGLQLPSSGSPTIAW